MLNMENVIIFCCLFNGTTAAVYFLYYLLSHECLAFAFYGFSNDLSMKFLLTNFGISLFFAVVILVKRLALGDLRLIELQVPSLSL